MKRRRRVSRLLALLLTTGFIVALGFMIRILPGEWSLTTEQKGEIRLLPTVPEEGSGAELVPVDRERWRRLLAEEGASSRAAREQEVRVLFEHGIALMQERRLEQAAAVFDRLVATVPLPEAYVNYGFVRYDQQRYDEARALFERALTLNPAQGNGYYGLAIALEALGDLEGALGAMRTFLHVTEGYEDFKRRGRAALWEWEARLGRVSVAVSSAASTVGKSEE